MFETVDTHIRHKHDIPLIHQILCITLFTLGYTRPKANHIRMRASVISQGKDATTTKLRIKRALVANRRAAAPDLR